MTSFILFDTDVNPTSPSRRILPSPLSRVSPLFLYDRTAPMSRIWCATYKPERTWLRYRPREINARVK